MTTWLLVVCGLLALAGFVWLWPPGGLLVLGLGLLWVALVRSENRKAVRQ